MPQNQLVFDHARELVFAERYPDAGDFTYLAEVYDTTQIKNELWKGVRGVVDEYSEAFGHLDLSILNIWLTPASGENGKGGGFLYYNNFPVEQAHMAFSLRALDKVYSNGVDREQFFEKFILHELCHLVMYTEVGNHEETCEDFHSLLKAVEAPTHLNFETAEHVYKYNC